MKNIFESKKGIEILIYLYNNKNREVYCHKAFYDLKITYYYLANLVVLFEKIGLLNRRQEDRKKILTLTKEGNIIAQKLVEINNLLKEKF